MLIWANWELMIGTGSLFLRKFRSLLVLLKLQSALDSGVLGSRLEVCIAGAIAAMAKRVTEESKLGQRRLRITMWDTRRGSLRSQRDTNMPVPSKRMEPFGVGDSTPGET